MKPIKAWFPKEKGREGKRSNRPRAQYKTAREGSEKAKGLGKISCPSGAQESTQAALGVALDFLLERRGAASISPSNHSHFLRKVYITENS